MKILSTIGAITNVVASQGQNVQVNKNYDMPISQKHILSGLVRQTVSSHDHVGTSYGHREGPETKPKSWHGTHAEWWFGLYVNDKKVAQFLWDGAKSRIDDKMKWRTDEINMIWDYIPEYEYSIFIDRDDSVQIKLMNVFAAGDIEYPDNSLSSHYLISNVTIARASEFRSSFHSIRTQNNVPNDIIENNDYHLKYKVSSSGLLLGWGTHDVCGSSPFCGVNSFKLQVQSLKIESQTFKLKYTK